MIFVQFKLAKSYNKLMMIFNKVQNIFSVNEQI